MGNGAHSLLLLAGPKHLVEPCWVSNVRHSSDVMLSTIWHVSSTRLFADENPWIFTVFIFWCCCPCIFLSSEGSENMETCFISYWDTYNIYKMKKGGKKVISHGPAVLATCYHRNMNSNLHPRRKFPRKGNHQKWKQEINNRRPDERLKRKIK
jgi:hypothetical protein